MSQINHYPSSAATFQPKNITRYSIPPVAVKSLHTYYVEAAIPKAFIMLPRERIRMVELQLTREQVGLILESLNVEVNKIEEECSYSDDIRIIMSILADSLDYHFTKEE